MKSAYFTVRAMKKGGSSLPTSSLKPELHTQGETARIWYQGQQVTEVILADRVLTAWKRRLFLFFEHILKSYLFYVYQHLT